MILSILCYLPPSVELLGLTPPSFSTWTQDPQFSNQIDAADTYTHHQRETNQRWRVTGVNFSDNY